MGFSSEGIFCVPGFPFTSKRTKGMLDKVMDGVVNISDELVVKLRVAILR